MSFRFDAVVVSDLQLGTQNSRSEDLLRFLDAIETDRLIVAGDVFDDSGMPGVSKDMGGVSIVDKFLEHSRFFYFENDGDPECFSRALTGCHASFFRRNEVMLFADDGYCYRVDFHSTTVYSLEESYRTAFWQARLGEQ
jgi:hypothetical protein